MSSYLPPSPTSLSLSRWALGLSFACLTKYILIKKLCAFLAVFSFFPVAASCRQSKVSQPGRRRCAGHHAHPLWFCFRWRRHCGVLRGLSSPFTLPLSQADTASEIKAYAVYVQMSKQRYFFKLIKIKHKQYAGHATARHKPRYLWQVADNGAQWRRLYDICMWYISHDIGGNCTLSRCKKHWSSSSGKLSLFFIYILVFCGNILKIY